MTTTTWGLPARESPCEGWPGLFDPVPILQTEIGMIVLLPDDWAGVWL